MPLPNTQPTATWNPARGAWETTNQSLCGHSELFSGTWPTRGSMRDGQVYALPTSAPLTDGSASSSSPGLLKTPTSQLAVNGGSQHPDKRKAGGHGPTLADEVEHLLPTGALLPTPRATDGTKGGPNQRGSSGDLMLPSAVMLLPTPVATDAAGTRNATSGRQAGSQHHTGTTLTDALLPTPRTETSRSSRRAMTGIDHWTAPSLEQAIELAQGILPREFESWDEVPGWHGGLMPPPSSDGNAA